MENLKKSILLILLTVSGVAQNKAIVPKSGAIVFNCKINIVNQEVYNQSKKEYQKAFLNSLKETIIVENKFAGIPVDTVKINQVLKFNEIAFAQIMNSGMLEDNNVKFCIQYQDTILKKYKIRNDLEDEVSNINTKTKMFVNDITEGFFEYSENYIKEVKEFKNQTKKINGYKCFKVIYTFSEPDLSQYSTLMSSYTNTREMWVTDKIKSDFHPIINDREIIMQYYPLEIFEYSDMIKGINRTYKLETIDLK